MKRTADTTTTPAANTPVRLWRMAAIVWGAWLASVAWNSWIFFSWALHPSCVPLLACLAVQTIAAAALLVFGTRRLWRGPHRRTASATLLLGTTPFWLLGAVVSYVLWRSSEGWIPFNVLIAQGAAMGASLGDLELRLRYPDRTEGERVVMFHRDAQNAEEQVAAADRHLARLELLLGGPARGKVHWVRGPLWGRSGYHFLGLSMSDPERPPSDSPDGLTVVDRHELAHFAIEQQCDHRHRPAFLLVEGWAEAQSGYQPGEMARRAMGARRHGTALSLAELTNRDWYTRDLGPVYTHGGPLVDYLLRTYGGPKFFELYNTCRPATFAADVQRVLGVSLEQLDRVYWADVERQCPPWQERLTRALEQLPRAAEVDEKTWLELARHHPATAALLAPPTRDGIVEITHSYSDYSAPNEPRNTVQRSKVLRSGQRYAWRNRWENAGPGAREEEITVAAPRESFRAWRDRAERQWRWGGRRAQRFARLAYLEYRNTIYFAGFDRWKEATFANHDIASLERDARVVKVEPTESDGDPTVDVTLEWKAALGRPTTTLYRFLPQRGWLLDSTSTTARPDDKTAVRHDRRLHYDFSDAERPRLIGAASESHDVETGKLLLSSETDYAWREWDPREEECFELASYNVAEDFWSRLPCPLSVLITWGGAGGSLILGLALAGWPRRRSGFPA